MVICGATTKTMLRYASVGVALLALDAGIVLALIMYFSIHPGVAQFIGRLSGALLGFVLHKYFTFRLRGEAASRLSTHQQAHGYLIVTLLGLLISPWILVGLINIVGFSPLAGKLLTDIVMVAITYVSLRWLFSEKSER